MFWKSKEISSDNKASLEASPASVVESITKTEEKQAYDKVQSALGAGTVISGKLSFDSAVRLDGKLSGEVYSTDCLIIGPTGEVDAQVTAKELIILGRYKGKAIVRGKTEIYNSGNFEGELKTAVLKLNEGGIFNADCLMSVSPAVDLSIKKDKLSSK